MEVEEIPTSLETTAVSPRNIIRPQLMTNQAQCFQQLGGESLLRNGPLFTRSQFITVKMAVVETHILCKSLSLRLILLGLEMEDIVTLVKFRSSELPFRTH